MISHAPKSLKTIFHSRCDVIKFVFSFHLSEFSLIRWIQLRWKSLQLKKKLKRLLHLIADWLAHFLEVLKLLKDAILTRCQSSNAIVLLSVQVVQLFLFLRLKHCTSVLHDHEFFYPLLLLWCQITFNIFVFTKEECELLFLSGRHGLFKQQHLEVLRQQGFLLR